MKTYEIHDNGGRPFFVTVDGKAVTVERSMDTYKLEDGHFVTIQKPRKHLFETKVDEIFIGKKSPTGGYNGLKPKEAEGNSILLLKGSKYIYIGSEIYEFTPVKGDIIEKYYSDIGNSDVPYPYAIGKDYIYIMLDKVAIEKSSFDLKKDIYKQYYFDDVERKRTKLKTKLLQKRL
jgi:hypothetical protein